MSPPVWLMRQAGRYLPEYQASRRKAESFWKLCMTPEMAVEVTLQPIARFDFDAAILFSDILVVPFALGQAVRFEDGIGPVLDPFPGVDSLTDDPRLWKARLEPIYEALSGSRSRLASEKTMLGFVGAPWTLAAYMLETRGSADQKTAKLFAYREPERFKRLIGVLERAVTAHLVAQLRAGADAVQIFDSWAGGLPFREFLSWVVEPTKNIVAGVRQHVPDAKIIGFPRATTQAGYEAYARETGVDAVSIDAAQSMSWARTAFGGKAALQGNLDPHVLIAGGEALDAAVDNILNEARGVPFIFNLGHGVLPETPVENVARLVAQVRGAK